LEINIGLRFDRNPSMPGGLEFLFLEHDDRFQGKFFIRNPPNRTIGYVLAECADGAIFFRGMHVKEHFRDMGLSKKMLRIWLEICATRLGISPIYTRTIDKPVLSLVLQDCGFQVLPDRSPKAVKLTVSKVSAEPGASAQTIGLWSAEGPGRVRANFSQAFLKSQNMAVLAEEPSGESRDVVTNAVYVHAGSEDFVESPALRLADFCPMCFAGILERRTQVDWRADELRGASPACGEDARGREPELQAPRPEGRASDDSRG